MSLREGTKQQMVASLCLMGDGPEGHKLFAFSSSQEEKELQQIAKRLCPDGQVDHRGLRHQIQDLSRAQHFSPLQEIHPGWIFEKLSDESPRLQGLLPRFIPSLAKKPSSGSVRPEMIEILRQLIEKKLMSDLSFLPPSHSGESFSFQHIVWMRSEDLRILLRDLGLEEIRKAFSQVDALTFRAFLSRFSPKEAAEIRERIERGGSVSAEVRKESQMSLVTLPLEHLTAEQLLREIGYFCFAGALAVEETSWGEMVCQKLAPEEGHRLKKMIHNLQGDLNAVRIRARKDEILERIFRLGAQGSTHRYWKKEKTV